MINLKSLNKNCLDMNLFGGFIFYDFNITMVEHNKNYEETFDIFKNQNDVYKTNNFFNTKRDFIRISKKGKDVVKKIENIDIMVNHFTPNTLLKEIRKQKVNDFFNNEIIGNVSFEDNFLKEKKIKHFFTGHLHHKTIYQCPKTKTKYYVNVNHNPLLNKIEQVIIEK